MTLTSEAIASARTLDRLNEIKRLVRSRPAITAKNLRRYELEIALRRAAIKGKTSRKVAA